MCQASRWREQEATLTRRTVGLLITLTLVFLGGPFAAGVQQPTKVYRIGILSTGAPTESRQWPSGDAEFLEELRKLGYVEGHNLFFEPQYAETRGQLPALAAGLVRSKVDLIVTYGTPATRAAQQATSTIPIVFALGADPVQSGLVASYARPGKNLTGLASGLYEDKLLEILKECVPGIVRVACLCRSQRVSQMVDAARRLGLELLDLDVLELQDFDMQKPGAFERFFAVARGAGADAVVVYNVAEFFRYLPRLGELATQSRLPAIGFERTFAASGGLLSYEAKMSVSRMAAPVDKILKGAKPADLPVEQPTKFELVINLKTAQALGLTIPPVLLLQADEVIR
jgi:putative tryptophan/tyrosine transport system substrate-binding protein